MSLLEARPPINFSHLAVQARDIAGTRAIYAPLPTGYLDAPPPPPGFDLTNKCKTQSPLDSKLACYFGAAENPWQLAIIKSEANTGYDFEAACRAALLGDPDQIGAMTPEVASCTETLDQPGDLVLPVSPDLTVQVGQDKINALKLVEAIKKYAKLKEVPIVVANLWYSILAILGLSAGTAGLWWLSRDTSHGRQRKSRTDREDNSPNLPFEKRRPYEDAEFIDAANPKAGLLLSDLGPDNSKPSLPSKAEKEAPFRHTPGTHEKMSLMQRLALMRAQNREKHGGQLPK